MRSTLEGAEDHVKKLARWIGMLLAAFLAAAVALPFLVDVNRFRPAFETQLSAALARKVKLGRLGLSVFSASVSADDLSIGEDPAYGNEPFLRAKSLRIGVDLRPFLLRGELSLTALTIDRPQVQLIQSEAGDWNFSSLGGQRAAVRKPAEPGPAGKSMDLSVRRVNVTAGRFSVVKKRPHAQPLVLDDVKVEVREFSAESSFPFSLAAQVTGGGNLKIDGKAGPIRDDVARTPLQVSLRMNRLDLAGSAWTRVIPDMAGIASIEGSVDSDGAAARVKGRLRVEKLKMAKTGTPAARDIQLDFEVQHKLQSRSGSLSKGDIRIGSAAASLTGTYASSGPATSLKMALVGPSMPVGELAAMLPAFGVVLPAGSSLEGGTASVKLVAEGPADHLLTQGSLGLNNAKLVGFDMGRKMSVIETLAGIKAGKDTEIEKLSMNVKASPDGIEAQDLQLVVPAIGELSGEGTVSPSNTLAFRMRAKLHTSGVAAALGKEAIPFTIEGAATNPVFRPDVKSVVKEKAKEAGRQGADKLLKGLFGRKEQ
jgi:AsmA protein